MGIINEDQVSSFLIARAPQFSRRSLESVGWKAFAVSRGLRDVGDECVGHGNQPFGFAFHIPLFHPNPDVAQSWFLWGAECDDLRLHILQRSSSLEDLPLVDKTFFYRLPLPVARDRSQVFALSYRHCG